MTSRGRKIGSLIREVSNTSRSSKRRVAVNYQDIQQFLQSHLRCQLKVWTCNPSQIPRTSDSITWDSNKSSSSNKQHRNSALMV